MLDLAHLRKVTVCGDGNCGFYSILASAGGLDHPWRARTGNPSSGDYDAQQSLRKECHGWLTGKGKDCAAHQLNDDIRANQLNSPFTAQKIKAILDGKKGPRDDMGSYCNSACMRAASAVHCMHLVVIDSRDGQSLKKSPEYQKPRDRVAVYLPGDHKAKLQKGLSWTNDIVPVLLRSQRNEALPTDPKYRVIIHNGEPAGSWSGHFDATALQ